MMPLYRPCQGPILAPKYLKASPSSAKGILKLFNLISGSFRNQVSLLGTTWNARHFSPEIFIFYVPRYLFSNSSCIWASLSSFPSKMMSSAKANTETLLFILVLIPSDFLWISSNSGSKHTLKGSGESGSPCLTLLIICTSTPLLLPVRISVLQFLHISLISCIIGVGILLFLKQGPIKLCRTVSKALAISTIVKTPSPWILLVFKAADNIPGSCVHSFSDIKPFCLIFDGPP
jgi:hypothetical protein